MPSLTLLMKLVSLDLFKNNKHISEVCIDILDMIPLCDLDKLFYLSEHYLPHEQWKCT